MSRLPKTLSCALICLLGLSTALAQGTAQTELKLGVDRTRVKVDKLGKTDSPALQEVLKRRLQVIAGDAGEVEVKDRDEIRIVVPLEKMTDQETRVLTQPGRLEFRVLEDVHSSLNPDGKYLIDVLTVQNETTLRFRERESGRQINTSVLINRSPLLFANSDFAPNGAQALGNALVRIRLNERAEVRLKQFLKKPGRLMAVVLDGEILAINASVTPIAPPRRGKKKKGEPKMPETEAPAEQPEENSGTVDVPGSFTKPEEAGYLAGVINAGPLPFPLTVRSRRIVAESQSSGSNR